VTFRTQRDVERLALPPGNAEIFHFDARRTGLSVRITAGGARSWVAWFTAGGKRGKISLGAVDSFDLEEARRRAGEQIDKARRGLHPGLERRRAREAAAAALTLGQIVKDYLDKHAARRQRPRTLIETKRALEEHAKPLHRLPIGAVSRRDASTLLLKLTSTSGPVAANRTRAHLSALFSWAMQAGLAEHNPTIGTVRHREASRERVHAPDELRAIWSAAAGDAAHARIVRLLVLLGARKSEVGGLMWSELDLEQGIWLMPGSRSKNGRPHEWPLPAQAIEILAGIDRQPNRPYPFGRHGKAPFSGWSRSKQLLDAKVARARAERRLGRALDKGEEPEAGDRLERWTLHDLRRSFSTHMADKKIAAPHIVEEILGHAGSGHKSGSAGVYNLAQYRDEKAAALQRWADWIVG
jgi:integrase